MTTLRQDWSGVRVRVPAKINVGLAVGGLAADGYHPLSTIFQAVSLYDDIAVEAAPAGVLELVMHGEGAEALAVDDTNLAIRAGLLLLESQGLSRDDYGASISIKKGIPIAGGMAGGSADAAGTLLALSVLWDLDISPEELHDVGAQLGADVPFSLLGGTALGTGHGDQLAPVLTRGTYYWVIALADEGLSTPAVYRRFDELALGAEIPELDRELMVALAAGDVQRLGGVLRNDLQQAACDLRPELRTLLDAGLAAGAVGAIVSGSGPTCAFLAAGEAGAMDLLDRLQGSGLARDYRRVHGPVGGARLLVS
ncbi:MAG: 4-(cytidine 5'-diphospho)-2-C-methyl-D-erythritol kinase [Propionibacteriaceae bacterium]